MAHQRDPMRIQFRGGHQIIDRPVQAPRPCGDGRAIRRLTLHVIGGTQFREHRLGGSLVVRDHIAIPKRRHRVSAINRLIHGPGIDFRAARLLRGLPILWLDPSRDAHRRVSHQRLVAIEVQAQENSAGARALIRGNEKQMDAGALGPGERERDFPQRGLAAQARLCPPAPPLPPRRTRRQKHRIRSFETAPSVREHACSSIAPPTRRAPRPPSSGHLAVRSALEARQDQGVTPRPKQMRERAISKNRKVFIVGESVAIP